MKKRNIISLGLCLLLLVFSAGCNSSQTETASKQNDMQTLQKKADNNSNMKGNAKDAVKTNTSNEAKNKPGSSEKKSPDQAGDNLKSSSLFGQVQSISENKISLAVAQKPQRRSEVPQGEGSQAQAPQDKDSQHEPPVQDKDSQPQAPAPGEKPAGPPPGAGASPELTGEIKTITVPGSAKIVAGGRGESQETTIDKIKTGDMLEVFFKDKTDEVELIRVMQARQ